MGKEMTKKQIEIMRHTLGADSDAPGYRNYFAAEPETDDYDEILSLVMLGLMKRGRSWEGNISGELVYFHVTEKGKKLLGIEETD